ncbi:Aldo_ket_red domain-containing protein [Cephalotus follicularis]|uniref:Aldo_ket_red domain-containing protein n=1 Tax=Cephalotus follicularis TaxID=3775 RepID=A0A1Q3CZR0_CEPFO|nr:Aldo_ket_red domain-containing protein [Cephalotus follicularis]
MISVSSNSIPVFPLKGSGRRMPLLGMGLAVDPPVGAEATKQAVLQAIQMGYRHFDTAPRYQTEQPLGEAITEALSLGFIQSRDDLFITSKLWCPDAHAHLVLPALHRTLKNLKMEYLDLYLIHWPVSSKPGIYEFPIKKENFLLMDFKSVWAAMEDCQRLGLTKSIGLSNFSSKKLTDILNIAKIPPAVNQVEMNPLWQQKKLKELSKANGILLTAFAVLGSTGTFWGSNRVMECDILKEIAEAKRKTVAQVCLRWAFEQGVSVLVKSFKNERMKENLHIFDWELTKEETKKISEIPQCRGLLGECYMSFNGPHKTAEELWDGEI